MNNKPTPPTKEQLKTEAEAQALLKNLDINKFLGVNKAKGEDELMKSMANERAAKEPIPTVVEDIFMPEEYDVITSIGKVTIRDMKAFDLNIFKKTNSPYYQAIMGDWNEKSTLFADDEQSYELIYQFTHPVEEVYKLYKTGVDNYHDVVTQSVGFVYSPKDVADLLSSILKVIFHVDLKKVSFDSAKTESGDDGKKKELMSPENLVSHPLSPSPVGLASNLTASIG